MSNFAIPSRFPNPTVVADRLVSDSNRPPQRRCPFISRTLRLPMLLCILAWSVAIVAQTMAAPASESVQPLVGPGGVIVHSKFGGQIFGFDVDQNGTEGVPNVAVFVEDNSGGFTPLVFSSNVAANTFGPITKITDSNNFGSVPPPIAYDSRTNQAILGGGPGCFGCLPVIGLVDLTKGKFTEFTGTGFGFINGIAVRLTGWHFLYDDRR
jgi:hypothetical protein